MVNLTMHAPLSHFLFLCLFFLYLAIEGVEEIGKRVEEKGNRKREGKFAAGF